MFVIHIPLSLPGITFAEGGNFSRCGRRRTICFGHPFWFMRTYLCLYLISPVINLFLSRHSNTKQRASPCSACWHSSATTSDPQASIRRSRAEKPRHLSLSLRCGRHPVPLPQPLATLHRTCGRCWCGLNIGLVLLFTFWTSRTANALYSQVWFSYCSFGLLVNALLFSWMDRWPALPFAAHQPHRPLVACHLPDPRGTVCRAPRHRTVRAAFHLSHPHRSLLLGAVLLMTLDIVAACVAIDHLLNPVWRRIDCPRHAPPDPLEPSELHLLHALIRSDRFESQDGPIPAAASTQRNKPARSIVAPAP